MSTPARTPFRARLGAVMVMLSCLSGLAPAAPAAASDQAIGGVGGNVAVDPVVAPGVLVAVAEAGEAGEATRLIVDVGPGGVSPAELEAAGVETVAVLDELDQVIVDAASIEAVDALAGLDAVQAIEADQLIFPTLVDAKSIIGQPAATAAGATGSGEIIAVLDTGITLSAFGCSTPGGTCPIASAEEVNVAAAPIAGYSTVGSADGAYDDDPNMHGSRVSTSALAAAPAARIAFIDVFARYNCTGQSCPYGSSVLVSSDSMLAAGLNRVLQLRNGGMNIHVVNISAGSVAAYAPGTCQSGLAATFNLVRASGILPVVAAGNEGSITGLASPACLSAAFSVGATYDLNSTPTTCDGHTVARVVDGVTCFSNSSPDLELFAPGSRLTMLSVTVEGTSFSAPLVAGAAAALWSAKPGAALETISSVLVSSGPFVTDSRNGLVKRRLDINAALGTLNGFLSTAGPADGFVPVTPVRALDTRAAFGPIGVAGGPLGTAAQSFSVTDALGVLPGDVAAVVLNLTGITPGEPCYLTVWPNGSSRPFSSNLNLLPGQTLANSVIVGVGADGRVGIGASCPAVDVAADVTGWFPLDADLHTVSPFRLVDTRLGQGVAAAGPVGSVVAVAPLGVGGLPSDPALVDSVLVNVTVAAPTEAAYLTIWPSDSAQPYTSSLNFGAGETATNFHIAKIGADGRFAVAPSNGSTQLIVDVFGWVPKGSSAYRGVEPQRILDTRYGQGVCDPACASPGGGGVVRFAVTNLAGVPADARAVALKVTAASATSLTYVTLYPTGMPTPNASNLFVTPGAVVPNLVTAKVGLGGAVDLFNAAGTTAVVVDVVGYYP
ncbi:MAG: S8 family serine peptidase [Acidimicrobiia bacterium]